MGVHFGGAHDLRSYSTRPVAVSSSGARALWRSVDALSTIHEALKRLTSVRQRLPSIVLLTVPAIAARIAGRSSEVAKWFGSSGHFGCFAIQRSIARSRAGAAQTLKAKLRPYHRRRAMRR